MIEDLRHPRRQRGVEEIVKIIYECAHSGQKGDGIVWVTDVGAFRRLRHVYD